MEIYKSELKKMLINPICYITIFIMVVFSILILNTENSVYGEHEESIYRVMCKKHEGVVNSEYLIYMEQELESYDKKLAEFSKVEENFHNGLINEIEYSALKHRRDKITNERQIFLRVYNRALNLDKLKKVSHEYMQSANPGEKAKGESLHNASSAKLFYDTGWVRFFTVGYFEFIFLLGIGVILGNVFASEFELGAWAIIFPTLKGRSKLAKIKLLAGTTFSLIMAVCFFLLKYVTFKYIYNLDNIDTSVISVIPSIYSSLSIRNYLIFTIVMQIVGSIVFAICVMFLSLFCKNLISTYVSSFAALLITFLLNAQPGKIHIFSLWWNIISPERLLGGKHVVICRLALGAGWIYILIGFLISAISIYYCTKYFGSNKGRSILFS